MTTWYEATETVVEAANIAMREWVGAYQNGDDLDTFRAIWEPVALALFDSIPDDMDGRCGALEGEFVGVTSDTRRIVRWGPEIAIPGAGWSYAEFTVGDRYDA